MISTRPVIGIILMAGEGHRFASHTPKQFHPLKGQPLYQWTLDVFVQSKLFDQILLVTAADQTERVRSEVGSVCTVITGGKTRQASSRAALATCPKETEIVVIHDGVRPFVSKRILEENIEAARKYGAANTCIPSADTLVHAPIKEEITAIPKRSEFLLGQTPQSFSFPLILFAHEKTEKANATDDCQLILEQGGYVRVVAGEEGNLKITSQFDWLIAQEKVRLDGLEPSTLSLKVRCSTN